MLGYKENNPVNHVIRLLKDMANRHHHKRIYGSPNVMKKWVGLKLLHLVLYPVDDSDRISLDQYPLRMQLLPSICDAHLGSSELGFWDQRLKEKRAPHHQ